MKKIFVIITILFLVGTVFTLKCLADDLEATSGGIGDIMDATKSVENGFLGQKQISDEAFQKMLEKVKAKQGKKYKKEHNIKPPMKGSSVNEENNGGYIDETAEKNLLLTSPVELITDEGVDIPIGHYKIIGKKETDGFVHLDLYQSSTLIAKIPAIETKNDFDEIAINFVKLEPYNEKKVKIIYGSMDFNAYTFVKIKHEISD